MAGEKPNTIPLDANAPFAAKSGKPGQEIGTKDSVPYGYGIADSKRDFFQTLQASACGTEYAYLEPSFNIHYFPSEI
jgi:hypothetical protein